MKKSNFLSFVLLLSFSYLCAQANIASQIGKVATAPIHSSYDIHDVNIMTLVGDTICLWHLGDDMQQKKFGGIILRHENGFSHDERKLLRMERGQTFQNGSTQERLVSMFFSPDKESHQEVYHKPFGVIREWRTFGFPFKDHRLGNDSVTTSTIMELETTFDKEGYAWMNAQKTYKSKFVPLPAESNNYYYAIFFWVLLAMFVAIFMRSIMLPAKRNAQWYSENIDRESELAGISNTRQLWLFFTEWAIIFLPVLLAIFTAIGTIVYDFSVLGFVYFAGNVIAYFMFYQGGNPDIQKFEESGNIYLKMAKWWFAVTSILGMMHFFGSIV